MEEATREGPREEGRDAGAEEGGVDLGVWDLWDMLSKSLENILADFRPEMSR